MQLRTQALISGCLAATLGSAHPAAIVNVSFIEPARFVDARDPPRDRDETLKLLSQHLQSLGQKYLTDDQTLKIEVLELDLAGHVKPLRRGGDVRVVRSGVDRPRIALRYVLEAGGQVVQRGEESVADLNFLGRIPNYGASDQLRYEKRLLDDWFRQRFVEQRPTSP
jgi:hypothetical protein